MEQRKYQFSELGERLKGKRGVIFSDVDGVWLNEKNNFAYPVDKSLDAIARAQSQGYVFVLNSDTGGDSLLQLSQDFGITSDICIAENGSYIQYGKEMFMVQNPDPRETMTQIRNQLTPLLSQSGTTWSGNATRAIRTGSVSNTSPLFMINTSRLCSIGVYARQSGMTVDQQLTDYVFQMLQETCCDLPEMEVFQYPVIGSCLIKAKNRPTKAEAVTRFMSITSYSGPCFMIGDSQTDDMSALGGKILTCAVGNASRELKARADIIEEISSFDQSAEAIITYITNS